MGSRACGARDAEVQRSSYSYRTQELNHLGAGVAVGVVEVGERVDDVILTCGSQFSFVCRQLELHCEKAIKG